ncbi:MAG: tRNA 2-thiouridine(34) synthase MnmA, partial [Deltaproteobacteria bacterium]|nr:tRNA 2-thiouridine(34) synthase MnmA [Deltaproteobacteria bacterium]
MREGNFHWEPVQLKPGSRVAVAMSGGVDSTIAARRLINQGHKVMAFHLLLTPDAPGAEQAQNAARLIGLNLEVIDLSSQFEDMIVNPFIQSYVSGETPNPCVSCNPQIKFSLFWEQVKDRGAEYLATGHYARLIVCKKSETPILSRPRDLQKDQTYFLCRLTPEMLSHAIFPLADTTKANVKKEALALGLTAREESQDVCFLLGENYREFLLKRLSPDQIVPGDFVDFEGRTLGRHRGLIYYTIGQRRALGLSSHKPYYVLSLDRAHNRVVLGTKQQT